MTNEASFATIISFLDGFLKAEYFLSEDFWYAAIDYYTSYTWLLKNFVYDCWKDRFSVSVFTLLSLGRVLIKNALLISRNRSEKR